MEDILANFKLDILHTLLRYFNIMFVTIIILWFILVCINVKYNIIEKIANIFTYIIAILTITTMTLYLITSTNAEDAALNNVKLKYDIKQHNDGLTFTKKPDVKNFIYKNEVNYKLTKEKVSNTYTYENKNISETKEERYILTDADNNNQFKLNKDQLKQLISYEKTENEKVNIDDLKS